MPLIRKKINPSILLEYSGFIFLVFSKRDYSNYKVWFLVGSAEFSYRIFVYLSIPGDLIHSNEKKLICILSVSTQRQIIVMCHIPSGVLAIYK